MLTVRRIVARLAVLVLIAWSVLMYLLWGTWLEPYAGRISCPEGMPECHDGERPPFALWWVVGAFSILVVAWIVGRHSVRRSRQAASEVTAGGRRR